LTIPVFGWTLVVNHVDLLSGGVMPVLSAPPAPTHELPGARFTSLATPSRGSTDTSVWRVEIDPGTPATPHQVTREEVFVVLEGIARVRLGGTDDVAGPGGSIIVPPGVPFELVAAGDAPLRALCVLPVGGQAQLPGGEPFTPPWAQ
jgi:quercetin dioxygenase-like cupin family protein